jgi:Fe-S-cluster formation regulator IscX/YfhJ
MAKVQAENETILKEAMAKKVDVVQSDEVKSTEKIVRVPREKGATMARMMEVIEGMDEHIEVVKVRVAMWQEYRAVIARKLYKVYPESDQKEVRDADIKKQYPKNADDLIQIIESWLEAKANRAK